MATRPKKLPSGNWNTQVFLPNGRRKSFTDPLKRVVVERAAEFEAALRRGENVHRRDRRLTVAEWEAKWTAARNVEATTADKDASQIRTHVLPRWGAWPLHTIGRLDVQAWIKDMTAASVGANTVTGAYHRLAAMLSDAVLDGLITASPCREIDLPKVVKPEPRWLSKDEYGRIQLALAAMPRPEAWQPFVALGCYSGLRPGELAGLDISHLDLDRRLVRVQQVMTRHGLRAYPKSDTSVRSVPFPDEVAALLWRLVGDRGQGSVFTSPRGERVSEVNFRNRVWRQALDAAGVERCRVYVMRHTAASWLIQSGVPDYEVARMLGHSSTRIISTYAHLAPDRHDRIRAAWGSAGVGDSGLTAHVVHTPRNEGGPVQPDGASDLR